MLLVTGATGVVGSHLMYHLLQQGYEVYGVKRATSRLEAVRQVFSFYEHGQQLFDKINWLTGDVLDESFMNSAIEKCKTIFHCAAVVSFNGGDRSVLEKTNIQGPELVASLCLKHNKSLVYISSIAALGDQLYEGDVVNESHPINRNRIRSIYSQSKMDAERVVWNYIELGLKAIIINPSIILTAGHWGQSSSKLFMQVIKGMPFYTNGSSGYVDVRDLSIVICKLYKNPKWGERYIVNGGNYSYKQLFSTLAKAVDKRPPFIYLSPSVGMAVANCSEFVSKIFRRSFQFTKETARTSQRKSYYSSEKLLATLPDFKFTPLEQTARWIAAMWRRSN